MVLANAATLGSKLFSRSELLDEAANPSRSPTNCPSNLFATITLVDEFTIIELSAAATFPICSPVVFPRTLPTRFPEILSAYT
jgi:hypothetical protein